MSPVDGGQMVMGPGGGHGAPPNTIPLSTLIDHIIQRTYHDLTVLSELLPRKTDMERKIEIVQFANRSRQLFVRLLALVKWANSAGKVDKCAVISNFLDQQALLFVETADILARTARETLVQARLPSFSIPCAVDVLTTGTYPRLPACIKETIIPPDPITLQEKKETLAKLNQIIEHRLVTGELPTHMRRPVIENGRVKFRVKYEFEATLTLMGDGPDIPWRLLDVEILVEDPETGDGIALVHSLQVNYIHELVQSRLMDNDRPLHDLYNVLHCFCQSLQLEVLHSQGQRLIHQRLREHVRIEEYIPGKSLNMSYWRDPSKKESKPFQQIYKLSIHTDDSDPSKPLQLGHFPQIQGSESIKVAQAIRSDQLSVEKLLIHSIQVRGLAKLKELERELRLIVPGPCEIRDLPTVLYVPVLYPCMESERLSVAVDVQKGNFLVSLCLKENDLTLDIQDTINSDKRDLRRLLSKVRLWLALQRCEKSIQHIHTSCVRHLPLINMSGHPLEDLGANKLFIKLPKQTNYYLIVEATETYKRCVDHKYYLLEVAPSSFDDITEEESESLPKMYLKAGQLVELDKFACTHGPGAKVHDIEAEDPNPLTRKRKLFKKDTSGPIQKKFRDSSYFVPELPHILAQCEDRLPFVLLGRELEKKGIHYTDIEVEGEGIGFSMSVLEPPATPGLKKETQKRLQNELLSCKFRILRKGTRPSWIVESVFWNVPIHSTNPKESGPVYRVLFGYDMSGTDAAEKAVQGFIEDWTAMARLYELVAEFSDVYMENSRLFMELEVKSYTYKRLTLGYGPNKCYTATINYKTLEKKDPAKGGSSTTSPSPEKKLNLVFGSPTQTNISNCHTITVSYLDQILHEKNNLAYIAQLLIDTWSPLCSIGKLNTSPYLGLTTRQSLPTSGFTLIPQSATHTRIIFREQYCLDVHCQGNRVVAVRDGAYGMFDTSKVVEAINPIPGIKSFLNLFVDESITASHSRRRSTTEDDHPPSPVGMDPMDTFMGTQHPSGSPASKGLTFKSPMTPPSNPLTPASPVTGSKMAHPSPATSNFPLASPPSLGPSITPSPSNIMAPSPGNPNLHVPSPGSFVPVQSPSSLGIHMSSSATAFISPQGMLEGSSGGGSPFPAAHTGSGGLAMPSPGGKNWPASPSVPGPSPRTYTVTSPPQGPVSMMSPPSRILPQRSWAASTPTLLSHDAFEKLLSPMRLPGSMGASSNHLLCPLERFLSCVFLRRHVHRLVQSEENLQQVPSSEVGVVQFKVESLQMRVSLHPTHLQCLILKVTPMPEFQAQWDSEELQILEKFFENKAACSPYKANAITTFGRILAAPLRVLKDFIQIMKLELVPNKSMKWILEWCLTIPYGAPLATDVGVPAVVLRMEKILILLRLTQIDPPPNTEAETLVVPILYNRNDNETSLVDQRSPGQPQLAPTPQAIKEMLKKFHQFNPKPSECSIYPALSEVLSSLPSQNVAPPTTSTTTNAAAPGNAPAVTTS